MKKSGRTSAKLRSGGKKSKLKMKGPGRVKEKFGREVSELRRRIAELEKLDLERKQAEKVNLRLAEIVRHANGGVILTDPAGRTLYVNPAFEKMSGYSQNKLLDHDPAELIVTDDAKACGDKIRAEVKKKGEWTGELICRRKNGETYPIESRAFAIRDARGKLVEIAAIQQDITERKRYINELLRHALVYRSMQEAVLIFDRDGIIVDANPAAKKIFGWSRRKLLGKSAEVLNPPEAAKDITASILKSLRKSGVWRGEIPLLTKSGEKRTLSTIVSSLKDQSGNWIGNVGINRDITERKRMGEELLKIRKLESVGILAGGIAHDFNNILLAILGNISFSKTQLKSGSEALSALKEAEKACLRAKNLTQQLLTFSKGGTPVKKSVSISELVKETANFILSGSNVGCKFSLPADLWPVEVDEGQISQVINNLIINAVQAMPEGGVIKVETDNVTVRPESGLPLRGGKYVRIAIEDEGTGIAEAHLAKIFDPYFSTKKRGNGLGLAIAYSIVKNHGGLVTVESETNAGSIFYVYLPASRNMAEKKNRVKEKLLFGKGKVLFMDDEKNVRAVGGRIIKHLGYQVELARDGAEAIELYQKAKDSGQPFDAVVLDLTVSGGMGGRETIKRLAEIDSRVKAIVSTGYSTDQVVSDYRKYGFSGVILKPYEIMELGAVLRRVMESK